MKKYLKKIPAELKELIKVIVQVSAQTNMPAYLVGGFLRDLILQVKNFDLDVAVEGDGIIFAQVLAKELEGELKTHERFGTATLTLSEALKVDIATARKEKYPNCGCLPVVSAGSLNDDLARRDFSVNALAASITGDNGWKLIDLFGGRDDLSSGKIRILHDLSFNDDPTRILRAIRFEQRFNFKIEPKTMVLLKGAVKAGLLNKVTPHRLRDELILMLKEQDPLKQIKRLNNLCGLSFISKKIKVGKSTYNLFKSLAREISWFNKNFPHHRKLDTWLIYFTALLERLTLKEIEEIAVKLGLRSGEEKRIVSYHQARFKLIKSLSKKSVLPASIFFMLEPLSYETIILLRAVSQNENLKKYVADFIEIYNGMRLCVSGNDLSGLGVLPGPRYKKIFAQALEAKLNGRVRNRKEELVLIRKLIKITN
ncbi:MAG: hypothetical protein WCY09_03160 [Candidatus Omnitrophota bacterium]